MHLLLLLLLTGIQSKAYNRLFEDLLGRYNKLVRPSSSANDTVRISFQLKLSELVDVHEKEQVITTKGALIHQWYDARLSWNPSFYGGIRKMQVPGELVWLPDIILYNNANGSPHVSSLTKAEMRHDGLITWKPPVVYNSMCKINVEWFPYDEQYCDLKFGSWTYSGTQLDLVHLKVEEVEEVHTEEGTEWTVQRGIDTSEYQESVEFDLLSVVGTRHEKYYPCCTYPSIDITYYINIRRKKLFYTVNLVTPCFGLAALTSFVFYLPCESHQKLQLCISVLVSLAFFFMVLMDNIPPTSLCIPLIGKYLVFTMLMVTASVIMTVVVGSTFRLIVSHVTNQVNNFHYRPPDLKVPDWMRRIFIEGIGSRLLISRRINTERKRKKETMVCLHMNHINPMISKKMTALNAMMILEKQFNKTLFHLEMATRERTNKEFTATSELFLRLPLAQRSRSVKIAKIKTPSSFVRQSSIDKHAGMLTDEKQLAVSSQLRRAERNVHYIAQTLVARRKAEENVADWRFISLVIDRIFLIIFAAIITTGSIIALFSAPSIQDSRPPILPNPRRVL